MYCGTDIIEVDRIKKAILNNDVFLKKIYSENEIKEIERISSDYKYQRYAGRFAAKEAILKAVSKLCNDISIEFKCFEILNDKNNNNRPYVNILNDKIKNKLKNYEIDISISHVEKIAISMCVVKER